MIYVDHNGEAQRVPRQFVRRNILAVVVAQFPGHTRPRVYSSYTDWDKAVAKANKLSETATFIDIAMVV